MKRILVAEDDANIRETLADLLSGEGYEVKTAADGEAAVAAWRGASEPFDLIMLDVMMPGKSGYDVCREIRASGSRVAVLMLSAKGEEIDKVIGLELGADDYVTKPFGVRELLARVAAAIRRSGSSLAVAQAEAAADADFPFCGANASVKRYVLEGAGKSVAVTELEMKLMKALSAHKGEVMTRDALLNLVWGTNYYGTTRTLDQHLVNLRRKLERIGGDPSLIRTVHGVGYSFIS
jgi:DNA-binding response OmpR family regulator